MNPNCDGSGPHGDNILNKTNHGEVRILPTGPQSNAILCFECFVRELQWRHNENKRLARENQYNLPGYDTLEVYNSELPASPAGFHVTYVKVYLKTSCDSGSPRPKFENETSLCTGTDRFGKECPDENGSHDHDFEAFAFVSLSDILSLTELGSKWVLGRTNDKACIYQAPPGETEFIFLEFYNGYRE